MAVLESRQVVAWSIPTLALLVSLLWLRRRYRSRDPPTSDPGGLPISFSSTPYRPPSSSVEICTLSPVASDSLEDLLSAEEVSCTLDTSEKLSSTDVSTLEEPENLRVNESLPSEEEKEEQIVSVEEAVFVSDSVTLCDAPPELEKTTVTEEIPDVRVEVSPIDTEVVLEKDLPELTPEEETPSPSEENKIDSNSRSLLDSEKVIETIFIEESVVTDLEAEPSCSIPTASEIEVLSPPELESNKELSSDTPDDKPQTDSNEMEKGVLEEKLASLVLDTMKINGDEAKQNAERDSANQSPSEVMLASPSISNFSDAHSEGSSDSGKGHSDVATSPSRTPAGGSSLAGDSAFSIYEFVLPQIMVGRLIGRHGSFIHEIRTSTHTNIFIKRHPETSKLKVCAIEGTQQDIDKALAKIRQKFPLRRFPKLTLEKVTFISVNNPPALKPEDFHLQLVEGVNNDVILSSLISAAHFFLQQPSHPTYSALSRLNQVMNTVYSNAEAPVLDTPLKDAICAAPTMGGWYRAQIVSVDEENQKCDVRFVDYGGYLTLESSLLRQIRGDLLMLPFQAVECYLANVVPSGEEEWSEEARLVVQSLTHGQVLQAQIYDYADDGTPLVYLYSTLGSQDPNPPSKVDQDQDVMTGPMQLLRSAVPSKGPLRSLDNKLKIILINEELVARGFAAIATSAEE